MFIKNWSLEDLQDYFDTYYAPSNAVVVISGDVDVAQIKKLATKYFEPIVSKAIPRAIHTEEPEQMGQKRVTVEKQVSTPNIMLAYHVPETKHEDYYALDLLSAILSEGNSSRFYSQLVDQTLLATSAFSYMPESIDPNLFYLYAVASPEVAPEILEKEMVQVIETIAQMGVAEKELQKVKNQKRPTH